VRGVPSPCVAPGHGQANVEHRRRHQGDNT
jgi:hypothetical protein